MRRLLFAVLLATMLQEIPAQDLYHISKPELALINNILTIKYDITGCGSGEFVDISLVLINSKGDSLKPRYITGDIGSGISCGLGKRIDWNLEKDKIKIDEDVEVIIKGKMAELTTSGNRSPGYKRYTRGDIVKTSALVPGLGQKRATGKSYPLVMSGLVYGGIGVSVYYTIKANDYKEKYNSASSSTSEEMFDKWQQNYNASRYCIIGTAAAYAGNLIWVALVPISNPPRKNLKVEFSAPVQDRFYISARWTF
jgi:hypothetical protein